MEGASSLVVVTMPIATNAVLGGIGRQMNTDLSPETWIARESVGQSEQPEAIPSVERGFDSAGLDAEGSRGKPYLFPHLPEARGSREE